MNRNLICPHLPEIIYGGDYNPEQWPEDVWLEDVQLMHEAGVNLVSLGIFSWAKLNPAPGEYTFGWLDRIMDLLSANGILVNLATATASPPAWLGRMYPEIRPVDVDGSVYSHGGRQCFTPNSKAFTEHALALVSELANRYKDHPALAMWHVNNEYHGNGPASYGELDAIEFRNWLKRKYQTLDALNEAWGTAFWSQWYYHWEEVVPPRKLSTGPNPSMRLDYSRFFSDAYIDLFKKEASILRAATPDIPVTTNIPYVLDTLDEFKLMEHSDFSSLDSYPDQLEGELPGLFADIARSIKPEKPWVLMEQVTSQIQWRTVNPLKRPGVMRLWSYSNVARGSDGVMFFQWRQGRFGSEKFHGAMVPAVGTQDSRVWREVVELGNELKKLSEIAGSKTEAKVAILFSYEILWALNSMEKPAQFNYMEEIQRLYQALWNMGVTVDFVHPDRLAEIDYEFLIAPVAYMLDETQLEKIRSYALNGGKLLVTYFSSLVDECDRLAQNGFPNKLQDILGIWVEEWDALPETSLNAMICCESGVVIQTDHICEIIHATEAEVLATYQSEFYAGKPALTKNNSGMGEAWYIASRPASSEGWQAVLEKALPQNCKDDTVIAPAGVEKVYRLQENGDRYLFLLNYNSSKMVVELGDVKGTDLLSETSISKSCSIPVCGVRILKITKEKA